MTDIDNPAGRLYNILSTAKLIPGNTPMGRALSRPLKYDINDTKAMFDAYVGLLNLIEKTKVSVMQLDERSRDLFLPPILEIEKAFNSKHARSFDAAWSNISPSLTDVVMTHLEHIALTLSKEMGEPTIPDEELEQLLDDVNELEKATKTVNIPTELKQFVIEQLGKIRMGITLYQVSGGDGLKDALEKTIGALRIFKPPETEETKESTKIKIGLVKIVTNLHSLVFKTKDILELAEPWYEHFIQLADKGS